MVQTYQKNLHNSIALFITRPFLVHIPSLLEMFVCSKRTTFITDTGMTSLDFKNIAKKAALLLPPTFPYKYMDLFLKKMYYFVSGSLFIYSNLKEAEHKKYESN